MGGGKVLPNHQPSHPTSGILLSRVRVEEKLLLKAFKSRNVPVEVIDDRKIVFDLHNGEWGHYDAILERCINHSRALFSLRVLQDWGVPTVNDYHVALVCGNKLETTSALIREGVPTPGCKIAFTPESALEAIEAFGYPVVLNPAVGSWGRLLSKVTDRAAAESLLGHKGAVGGYPHSHVALHQ